MITDKHLLFLQTKHLHCKEIETLQETSEIDAAQCVSTYLAAELCQAGGSVLIIVLRC